MNIEINLLEGVAIPNDIEPDVFLEQRDLEHNLCNPSIENFLSDEQYADELEKNIVQEILLDDDDSNAPLEEPPTLSEFIKSMDIARKFLQSGGASENELDHLYGLKSFAIKKKNGHQSSSNQY